MRTKQALSVSNGRVLNLGPWEACPAASVVVSIETRTGTRHTAHRPRVGSSQTPNHLPGAALRRPPGLINTSRKGAQMGITSSSSSRPESRAMALAKAKEIVASAPVVVFRSLLFSPVSPVN